MIEDSSKFWLGSKKLYKLIKSQKVWGILFILIAAVILVSMIYREREALLQFHWQFRPDFLILFGVFHYLAMLTQTTVWHLMMVRMTGIKRLWLDFQVYTISLVSRRIPGLPWYIGSRFALYPPKQVSSKIIAIVTGLEFGLIGFAGIICYIVFLPFYSITYNWPWQIFLGGGLMALILFILKPGIIIDLTNLLLKVLHREPVSVNISRTDLLIWSFIYFLTWFLDGASLYFWIKSVLPDSPGFTDVLGISTISALVSYVAQFLPSAFALKEITMSAMLGIWIPTAVGLIAALGYRIAMLLVELVLAIFFRFTFSAKITNPPVD